MSKKLQHTAINQDTGLKHWGTPDEILDAVRGLYGQIDLDPTTFPEAQDRVRALRFFTKEDEKNP